MEVGGGVGGGEMGGMAQFGSKHGEEMNMHAIYMVRKVNERTTYINDVVLDEKLQF